MSTKTTNKQKLTNLLEETKQAGSIESIAEIDFVFVKQKYEWSPKPVLLNKELFWKWAAEIWYDWSYGGAVINDALVIVLKNGSWLERHEYGGSESWVLKKMPLKFKTKEEKSKNKTLALMLDEGNSLPYNQCIIGDVSIQSDSLSTTRDFYSIWFVDKKNEVIIEQHRWQKGEYKKLHSNNKELVL
jgi:hypothetical protein